MMKTETLHVVRHQLGEETDTAWFSEKNPVRRKTHENRSKYRFFPLFSETTLTISMKIGQNVEEIDFENLVKTASQNFHRFQGYSTGKGRLGGPSMDRTQKILDPQIFF